MFQGGIVSKVGELIGALYLGSRYSTHKKTGYSFQTFPQNPSDHNHPNRSDSSHLEVFLIIYKNIIIQFE